MCSDIHLCLYETDLDFKLIPLIVKYLMIHSSLPLLLLCNFPLPPLENPDSYPYQLFTYCLSKHVPYFQSC